MSVGITTWQAPAVPTLPVRRFSVDEYHVMIQSGVLTENDPVELLEGWIVTKMSRSPNHDIAIELVDQAIRGRTAAKCRIRIQSAISTIDSEPEPDLAVVRGSVRSQSGKHPSADDVSIVVEVADSSLDRDREIKARLYARAGIAIYWIVNLVDSQVEVYMSPSGPVATPSYRERQTYGLADSVPLVIDGRELARVPVRELLP